MDIAELLKKIESGMTTADDALWLKGLMDEKDILWQMLAERHQAIRKSAQDLLDVIEHDEFRLTATTFKHHDQAVAAIQNLKDALNPKAT